MTFKKTTQTALRRFAATVVINRTTTAHEGRQLAVPKEMAHGAQQAGIATETRFPLDEVDEEAWQDAFKQLRSEPDMEHMDNRELGRDLESLFWKLTINHAATKDPALRNAIVRQYVTDHEAAVEEFQAIMPLEHLDLGETPLSIGDVTIRQVTLADMAEWYPSGDAGPFFKELPVKIGDVVAVTKVSGPSREISRQRAQESVDNSLENLRVAIVDFGFRIYDPQLRFERGRVTLLTSSSGGPVVWWSQKQRDTPREPGLANEHLDQWARDNLARLDWIRRTESSSRLLQDCDRAVRWIARSIRATDPDDKIVALCTAQECLLSTKDAGLKTADLAIRSMVLGELSEVGFSHPANIINLYQIRSNVVHGSDLGIASDEMYRSLLTDTLDVLYQVIDLIAHNPDLITKHKLLTYLDRQECLRECLAWCQTEDPEDSMELQSVLQMKIADQPVSEMLQLSDDGAGTVEVFEAVEPTAPGPNQEDSETAN